MLLFFIIVIVVVVINIYFSYTFIIFRRIDSASVYASAVIRVSADTGERASVPISWIIKFLGRGASRGGPGGPRQVSRLGSH